MISDELLLSVRRPGQYVGGEWNSSKKDFDKARVKFALCFPDLYEIGMSNLGMRIIYDVLNKTEGICCERAFAPDMDMEGVLRNNKLELFTLESQKALREFDLVGFSLSYELCFSNVLNMLELGGVPLLSGERDNRHPIVIGGGPCVLNPEPVHDFFDLFVLGEAEEAILEIVNIYSRLQDKFKNNKISRLDLLAELSGIEGVYVPAFYDVSYDADGRIKEFKPNRAGAPEKIKKRFIKDLDSSAFPVDWMVPYTQITHDRVTLEIMRGCPNRCSFCQARNQYYPFRQRKIENIISLAKACFNNTGYEEMSLMGLSTSDYQGMGQLLQEMVGLFKDKGVGISLPSIKPTDPLGSFSALIATIKKTGLTFAPEAGSQKLRAILNKNFNEDTFFKTIEESYASGYQRLKLYFMIGLPFEEQADLDGIIDFATRASESRRKAGQGPALVNVSINTLIPKPHTSLQWFSMETLDKITEKQLYLKKKYHSRKLTLNFHQPDMSFLEGVISRGDRRLSPVILRAFKQGARFDAWSNHFNLSRWLEALGECKVDPQAYLRAKELNEVLPWSHLDIGVSVESMAKEAQVIMNNK